jgi:hypothetical protein
MEHNPITTPHAAEPLALVDTPDEELVLPAKRSTRHWLEPLAIGIMALGFVMIFQPFALGLYTYSFIVILIGTLTFIVASHLPE